MGGADEAIASAQRSIAEALTALRDDAGLSQGELARRIAFDRTTVSHAERGTQIPSPSFWQACDDALSSGGVLARLYDDWKAAKQRKADDEDAKNRAARRMRAEIARAASGRQGTQEAGGGGSSWHDLDGDELAHLAAAREDAHRYFDQRSVEYFEGRLVACQSVDGSLGWAHALPMVRSLIGAIDEHLRDVKPAARPALLSVAARSAEFAGWACRDGQRFGDAHHWHDRACDYALEGGELPLVGFVMLRKAQMACDEREPFRLLALTRAALDGPWRLPARAKAELMLTEAHGLAMTGASVQVIEGHFDEAQLIAANAPVDDTALGGPKIDDATLSLRAASCFIEAGLADLAVSLYERAFSLTELSLRDQGYFLGRKSHALALAGRSDVAVETALEAVRIGTPADSARTRRELERTVGALIASNDHDGAHEVTEALERWRVQSLAGHPPHDI